MEEECLDLFLWHWCIRIVLKAHVKDCSQPGAGAEVNVVVWGGGRVSFLAGP